MVKLVKMCVRGRWCVCGGVGGGGGANPAKDCLKLES